MPNKIKYPIARLCSSGELIHISLAENGLACGCSCVECGGDLEAVNSDDIKITPHFRYRKDSDCTGNYETYVHLLILN